MKFPIGAILESFCMPTDDAVRRAAELGAQGIQMYCTEGEHAPENFSKEERKRLLKLVKSEGLAFSALCGDLGRGFGNKEENPELIARSKKIMELAADLETEIVTTHIGVVPADPATNATASCRRLALSLPNTPIRSASTLPWKQAPSLPLL